MINKENIKTWLADVVGNTPTPDGSEFPPKLHNDFAREWLFAVSDVAVEMAKGLPESIALPD